MKPKKNIAELLEGDFASNEEITEITDSPRWAIASLLFKARTDVHLSHIKQKDKTLATHNALSMFYEDVLGFIDTYVETSMGIDDSFTVGEVEESCPIDNPLQYFQGLYTSIDSLRKNIKESFIQNQIDEVQQLIAHTLYRLKNIKN